jgi:hypothetical protein
MKDRAKQSSSVLDPDFFLCSTYNPDPSRPSSGGVWRKPDGAPGRGDTRWGKMIPNLGGERGNSRKKREGGCSWNLE